MTILLKVITDNGKVQPNCDTRNKLMKIEIMRHT